MEDKLIVQKNFKYLMYGLIGIGIISMVAGFILDPERAWANYLLNNYYFVSLAVGAAFFGAIQYISQAGWSSAFKRIPEAMASYVPVAAVFFLLMYFGMHSLFHWSHEGIAGTDALLAHKAPYLNIPFFFLRVVLFFSLWIFMIRLLRKISLKEDAEGGMNWFYKSEKYSKIIIFIIAVSFSLFAIDMIMSLEPHWFSALFAAKSFIAAFLHASTVITLIVIILYKIGHLPMLNRSHLHDFSRYIFMLCIIWGYFNFVEFMLIWYGNIPEETIFFVSRSKGAFGVLFFANMILNWFIPFLFLMPRMTSRSKLFLIPVIILMMIGQYTELYYYIWPAVVHEAKFGLFEIGTYLGFLGLFTLVVTNTLSKASLVPRNHPYLEESIYHQF
ncbi:MAG: quinol:cytochrome C oxidoreductase [Bacteroidota bacterium]|nr:quinol:cytochrome C oxidoreductase [Bacteroidota bacterium]